MEYVFDHYCVESLLFDGTLRPAGGHLTRDRDHSAVGLPLDAECDGDHRLPLAGER